MYKQNSMYIYGQFMWLTNKIKSEFWELTCMCVVCTHIWLRRKMNEMNELLICVWDDDQKLIKSKNDLTELVCNLFGVFNPVTFFIVIFYRRLWYTQENIKKEELRSIPVFKFCMLTHNLSAWNSTTR